MPIVELDDGTEIEFPDDMSGDEIKAVLDKQYGKPTEDDGFGISDVVDFYKNAYETVAHGVKEGAKDVYGLYKRGTRAAAEKVSDVTGLELPELTKAEKDAMEGSKGSYAESVVKGIGDTALSIPQVLSYLRGPQVGSDLFGWTGMDIPERDLRPEEAGYLAQEIGRRKERLAPQEEADRIAYGRGEGIDWMRMAPGIALPAFGAGKVKEVAKNAPAVERIIQNIINNRGGRIGALGAMTQTTGEDVGEEKLQQAALGYAGGRALEGLGNVVSSGARAVYNPVTEAIQGFDWVNRLTNNAGNRSIAERALNRIADDKKAKLVQALTSPERGLGESSVADKLAEMSMDTGDVSGREFVKIYDDLSRLPEGEKLAQAMKNKELVRKSIIDRMVGTPEEYATAKSVREAATSPLMSLAKTLNTETNVESVLARIDDIIQNNVNDPTITKPLSNIRNKIVSGGLKEEDIATVFGNQVALQDFTGPLDQSIPKTLQRQADIEAIGADDIEGILRSTNDLMSLSNYIDKMIKAPPSAGVDPYDVKALIEVKKKLDTLMGESNEALKLYKKNYAEYSKPINKMDIAEEIRSKLYPASGGEKGSAFLRSMDDVRKLIKSGTGFERGTDLEKYFSPEEMSNLDKLMFEMNREAEKSALAGSLSKTQNIREPIGFPQLLDQRIAIANAILGRSQKADKPALLKEMANLFDNKERFIEALNNKQHPSHELANMIKDQVIKLSGQSIGREAGE